LTQSRTQVGRALAQLGIEHIAAYSPEARGRIPDLAGPAAEELALAGIGDDLAAANRFIRDHFLTRHNPSLLGRSPGSRCSQRRARRPLCPWPRRSSATCCACRRIPVA
jgi:hypothetical protein